MLDAWCFRSEVKIVHRWLGRLRLSRQRGEIAADQFARLRLGQITHKAEGEACRIAEMCLELCLELVLLHRLEEGLVLLRIERADGVEQLPNGVLHGFHARSCLVGLQIAVALQIFVEHRGAEVLPREH